MLSTTDAFMYAFSEIRKRPVFWIPIALLYVLLGSIRDAFPNDWILKSTILLLETVLYVVVVSVAIRAIANREYDLRDILNEPNLLAKAYILVAAIAFLGWIILMLPLIILYISDLLVKVPSVLALLTMPVMLLLFVFVVNRLLFAPFYFLDKRISMWQSVKESWGDSNYRVLLSILLSFLWMVALRIPLLLLDRALSSFYLQAAYCIVPIGAVAWAHMYMQLQNKKEKEVLE